MTIGNGSGRARLPQAAEKLRWGTQFVGGDPQGELLRSNYARKRRAARGGIQLRKWGAANCGGASPSADLSPDGCGAARAVWGGWPLVCSGRAARGRAGGGSAGGGAAGAVCA